MKLTGPVLLLVVLFALGASPLHAQKRNTITLEWGATIPAPKGDFLNRPSWVHPSLDWDYLFLPWLSAGLSVGYGENRERGITHDRFDGMIVDGHSTRKLTVVPIQARLRFFPLGGRMFRPLIYAGGGVQYAHFDITGDAIRKTGTKNWAAVFSAGLGVRIYPFTRVDGLFFEVMGGWQYAGNKFEIMETKSLRGVTLNLGIGFRI